MDYGILIAGIGIGAGLVAILFHFRVKRIIADHRSDLRMLYDSVKMTVGRLAALRRNAFLTNEHGHRVRYHKASAEVRARAEAGE